MKRYQNLCTRVAALLAGAVILLSGCAGEKSVVQNDPSGWGGGMRTGMARQGVSEQSNFFETTDQRVYFLSSFNGYSLVLSGTHSGRTLSPLCKVSNCNHDSPECMAWFPSGGGICVYEDNLYVLSYTTLYRMNPDGTNREKVVDLLDGTGEHDGVAEARFWNGILSCYLTNNNYVELSKDAEYFSGATKYFLDYDPYYYKLDGSMEKPEPTTDLAPQYNSGNAFIMRGPVQKNGIQSLDSVDVSQFQVYQWDPESNETSHLFDATEIVYEAYEMDTLEKRVERRKNMYEGFSENWLKYMSAELHFLEAYGDVYWGVEDALYLDPVVEDQQDSYFITNGVTDNQLCRIDYSTGEREVLLETGLRGIHRLSCFPDGFVISEVTSDESISGMWRNTKPRLHFYNWNYEKIGEYQFEEHIAVSVNHLICGESADRFYLATSMIGVPEYYIEKADLKNGEIQLRKLNYKGLNLDELLKAPEVK